MTTGTKVQKLVSQSCKHNGTCKCKRQQFTKKVHADDSNSQRKCNCLLYPIKNEKPILSFFIWNFAIEFISFSKRKEFNNGFDDWHSDVWLIFFYLHERSPLAKKQRQAKM